MESSTNVIPNQVLGISEGREVSGEKKTPKLGNGAVAAIFFGVSGLTGLIAGWISWHREEKKNSEVIAELKKKNNLLLQQRRNEGIILAMKALGWGTLYAVLGCSLTSFIIWKYIQSKKVQDYLAKKKQMAILASKNERTEFESWRDFFAYLLENYNAEKKAKKV